MQVMDLDLNINGAGLLAAALRADPDSVDGEGQAVMCGVPEEVCVVHVYMYKYVYIHIY